MPNDKKDLWVDVAPASKDLWTDVQQPSTEELIMGNTPSLVAGTPEIQKGIKAGVVNKWLLPTIARGVGLNIPKADEPTSTEGKVAESAVGMMDPTMIPVIGGASKLVKGAGLLVKEGTPLLGKLAIRTITGAAEGGAVGLAQESAEQLEARNFDIEKLKESGKYGAIGGAVFHNAAKILHPEPIASRYKEAFESGPTVLSTFEPRTANAMNAVDAEIGNVQKKISLHDDILKLPTADEFTKNQSTVEKAALERELASLQTRKDSIAKQPTGELKLASNKVKDELVEKGVLDESSKSSYVYIPPEEAKAIAGGKDIPRFQAGNWATQDIGRLIQGYEGQIRGPLYRMTVEPALQADLAIKNESRSIIQRLLQFANEAGFNGANPRQIDITKIFNALENKLEEGQVLSTHENNLRNYIAELTANLRYRANAVSQRYGLKEIGEIKGGYAPHYTDVANADKAGLGFDPLLNSLDPKFRKVLTSMRSAQKRTGELKDYRTDLGVFVDYMNAALKRIHNVPVAQQQMAASEFAQPYMKAALQQNAQSKLLGAKDPKTIKALEMGVSPRLLSGLNILQNIRNVALVSNSISVVLKQAATIPMTWYRTDTPSVGIGLIKAMAPISEELLQKSQFLSTRYGNRFSDKTLAGKVGYGLIGWTVDFAHRYVAHATWEAAYQHGLQQGLSEDAAHNMAEMFSRAIHSPWTNYLRPAGISGEVGRLTNPLKGFEFNLWNALAHDPKVMSQLTNSSRMGDFLRLGGVLIGTNYMYRAVGLPGPYDLLGMVPYFGQIAQGRYGLANLPVEAIKQGWALASGNSKDLHGTVVGNAMRALLSTDSNKRKEAELSLGKSALGFLPAGQQAINMIKAVDALNHGYYKVGQEHIKVQNPLAALLGRQPEKQARRDEEEKKAMAHYLKVPVNHPAILTIDAIKKLSK